MQDKKIEAPKGLGYAGKENKAVKRRYLRVERRMSGRKEIFKGERRIRRQKGDI
jgi:hypothetical protein